MNQEDGGPAFASPQFAVPDTLREEQIMLLRSLSGMSMRQYYKAHAPTEIPAWFEHVQPSGDHIPPMPSWQKIEAEEERNAASDWLNDPCYDLRDQFPSLGWFQDQVEACLEARQEWEHDNLIARAQQWPAYWADMMLAEDIEHATRQED